MTIAINGKIANSKPEDVLIINGRRSTVTPVVNGFVPYGININGYDRPPVLPGCVLYLPLWHPITSPSAFKSLDANEYLFTVTGAKWTPRGRFFDGSSYIKHGSPFRASDSSGTMLVWFKTSTKNDAIMGVADEGGTSRYCFLNLNVTSGALEIQQRNADTAEQIEGNTNCADGVWHLGAVISSGTAYSFNLDGSDDGTVNVITGADNGDWFADTTLTDNFLVGAVERNSVIIHWNGDIGEVWVYNQALTLQEIQRIYLATKWRY